MKYWKSNKINHDSKDLTGSQAFLDKISKIIEENLNNEKFGIEDLTQELNMSRAQIYRNIKKIKNVSISQYIREFRLRKAMELLQERELTVSEIAYIVGFGSPTYFNKCFHDYFGFPPGKLKKIKKPNFLLTKSNKRLIYLISTATIILILLLFFLIRNGNRINEIIPEKTIGILPFDNFSPDPENEYVCLGMVEDIYAHLQKIEELRVKSKIWSDQYKISDKNIKAIAKELDVTYILEGSIRKAGDDLRITVQLINGRTGDHIWADQYDGKYTEKIFEFQSKVAKKIASSLKVVITPFEEQGIDREPTTEIIAYDLVWKALKLIDDYRATMNKNLLDSAHILAEMAISIDSTYGRSYYAKGACYFMTGPIDSAYFYAMKAINLNPLQTYGYLLMGNLQSDPDSSIVYYSKAIELDSDESWAKLMIGNTYCMDKGDFLTGLPYINEALQEGVSSLLDKASEDGIYALHTIYEKLGWTFLYLGDYSRALKYFKISIDLRPTCYDNINGYFWTLAYQRKFKESKHFLDSICSVTDCERFCVHLRFQNYTFLGEYKLAEESFIKMSDIGRTPFILDSTKMVLVYKKLGYDNEGVAMIKSIKDSYENILDLKKYWIPNYALASIHSVMGNKDEALQYLSNAVDAGIDFGNLNFLEIDPTFQELWNDPQYKAILKRAQEEKAYIRAHFKLLEEKGEFEL